MIYTGELVDYLRSEHGAKPGFLQKLKIVYRPYICPFDDLLNFLPEDKKVFDIGCGAGTFLELIAQFKNPKSIAGIEISKNLTETATELLHKFNSSIPINLCQYNGSAIPDFITEYEYIFMIDVLHHIPESKQLGFLTSLHSKMALGAKLIIKDINKEHYLLCLCNKLHDIVISQEIGNEVGAKYLHQQLKKIGFSVGGIKERRMLCYPHYTIVSEKTNQLKY